MQLVGCCTPRHIAFQVTSPSLLHMWPCCLSISCQVGSTGIVWAFHFQMVEIIAIIMQPVPIHYYNCNFVQWKFSKNLLNPTSLPRSRLCPLRSHKPSQNISCNDTNFVFNYLSVDICQKSLVICTLCRTLNSRYFK